MSTSTYRVFVHLASDAEVTLQVDLDVLTPKLATEINEFWAGANQRLRAEDGDVVLAVVRMFGQVAINHFLADGGASFGPTSDPYWTRQVIEAQGEGWPDVDGLGILITAAEVFFFDYEDVFLEAL